MFRFAIAAVALTATTAAFASSGDAWAEFAAEVETGCLAAASNLFKAATAVVDPYGSESFGLAVVTGETLGGTAGSIICVFDKQTGAIEIGNELGSVMLPL